MQPMDQDLALIERAIAGDMQALESLLHARHDRLIRYVEKHMPPELRGAIEAADIVQDTYFEACRLFSGFQPAGDDSLFRWLVTIARHRTVDHLRAFRARIKLGRSLQDAAEEPVASLLEDLAVYRRTPSRSAASHEAMLALERAIERLPEEHRQVVQLRHIDGLSVEEVAQKMGRTPQAVYWLTSRALAAIREDLRSVSQFL